MRGIWNRSTKRRRSSPAPLRIAPKPISATTRRPAFSASAMVSAITSTAPGSGRTGRCQDDAPLVVDRVAAMREVLGHRDVHRPRPALVGEVDRLLDDVVVSAASVIR